MLLKSVQDPHVRLAVKSQLKVLRCIVGEVENLEEILLKEIKGDSFFKGVQTLPGVGPILGMTIFLETGEIKRFAGCGNYSSYCRCVESKRVSNAKKKGENNRKNGNAYLGWAFVEAANFAIRSYEPIQRCYQRKLAKTNHVVAIKTIANKLSKACYFILRDGVEFDMKKTFG